MTMKALRVRVSKFSVDGFWLAWAIGFDARGTLVTPVGLSKKSSDLSDSVARWVVSEFHVLPVLYIRPTTASAWRTGALSGSVNRYSREFESV